MESFTLMLKVVERNVTKSFCLPSVISAISQMLSLSGINLCLVGLEISYQQGHFEVSLFERHLAPVVCKMYWLEYILSAG